MPEIYGDNDQLVVLDVADHSVIANPVAPEPGSIGCHGFASVSRVLVLLLRPCICGCVAAWAYRVCGDLLLLCACARYAKTFAPLSERPHGHQMARCPARPRVHPGVGFVARHGGLLQHHVLARRCTPFRRGVLPEYVSGSTTCCAQWKRQVGLVDC